jgi:general secretion pathway protein K
MAAVSDRSKTPAPAGQRGFALLIVLWTLGLLALLGTQITGAARTQTRLAANLRANAVAEAAADGAARQAVFRLLQRAWAADGTVYMVRVGAAEVRVRIENLADRINPNSATPAELQGLLTRLGIDQVQATALSQAIADWRSSSPLSLSGGSKLARYRAAGLPYGPSGRPFETIDEIGLVLGMTPSLLLRLKPYMSVYQEGNADQAAGGVQPLGQARLAGVANLNLVAQVMAVAQVGSGSSSARFARQMVVRLTAEPEPEEPPYRILTWETVAE